MRIAVLTMTRDRLAYTQHCFGLLERLAGCDYDHFVCDNASGDGTREWLADYDPHYVHYSDVNLGVCRGANLLLDQAYPDYDVYVRFDNDCELIQPDTLKDLCGLVAEHQAILSPRVLGLLQPPGTISTSPVGPSLLDETGVLGGIFMAIPNEVFDAGWRFPDGAPTYNGDEETLPWWRARGGRGGYVQGYTLNHYETTLGQRARYPEYESRKVAEMSR